MDRIQSAFSLICAVAILSSCTSKTGVSMASDHVHVAQMPAPTSTPNPGGFSLSKYSPRTSRWVGDDYKAESLTNPGTDLPQQSSYTVPNPRTHLLQTYIDSSETPEFLPLNGWENTFRAGELALDSLDIPEADKMFRLAESEASKEPEPDRSEHRALTTARQALIARKNGDAGLSKRLYGEALAFFEKQPDKYGNPMDVILHELALIPWKQNQISESENYLRRRLTVREQQHGRCSLSAGSAMNDLGNCLYYEKKFAEADKLYLQALIIAQRFKDEADDTVFASYNLANCRYAEGAFADALALYAKSNAGSMKEVQERIARCNQEIAVLPASKRQAKNLPPPAGDPKIWRMLADEVKDDIQTHREWDTRAAFSAALAEALPFGKTDERYGETLALGGDFSFARGDLRDARNNYEQAQPILVHAKSISGKAAAIHCVQRLLLCELYTNTDTNVSKTLASLKSIIGGARSATWSNLNNDIDDMFVARRFNAIGQPLIGVLQDITVQVKLADGSNSASYATSLANLARGYAQSATVRDTGKAESLYIQAIQILDKLSKKDESAIGRWSKEVGQLYVYDGNYAEAEPLLKRSLAIAERQPGVNNRELAAAVRDLKYLYSRWDKPEEQEKLLNQELSLRGRQSARQNRYDEINRLTELADIAQKRENYQAAANYFEQIIQLKSKQPNADLSGEIRTLLPLYERVGTWDKVEALHRESMVALSGKSGSDQAVFQEMYSAGLAAFKQGNYDNCATTLQQLIVKMEAMHATKDKDYGCYYEEPRYSVCLKLLGNCKLDGFNRYDEAAKLYQRSLEAMSQGQNRGPAERDGPASDNRVRGTGTPVILALNNEQQLDFVICYDHIGDKANGDKYRQQLIENINRLNEQYARNHQARKDAAVTECVKLLNKTQRSKAEEIKLMELVSKSLHSPSVYSGNVEGAELLNRVIAWKTAVAGRLNPALKEDLQELSQQYIDARQFDQAEPGVLQLLEVLKAAHATDAEKSIAENYYGDIFKERGRYSAAIAHYRSALSGAVSHSVAAIPILTNIAYCFQSLDQYDQASKYLKEALALAASNLELQRDLDVRLAVLEDVRGQSESASKYYAAACNNKKDDCYTLFTPLRDSASKMSSAKKYALAERLYKREASLLTANGSSPVGICSAWTQLARMFKDAKHPEQAASAYRQALEVCRAHAADTFLKSQEDSINQEMAQLLKAGH